MAEEKETAKPTREAKVETGVERKSHRANAVAGPTDMETAEPDTGFTIPEIEESFKVMAVNSKQRNQGITAVNLYSGALTDNNPNNQFSITSTADTPAAAIRFGGRLGISGEYQYFGESKNASEVQGGTADDVYSDGFGKKLLKTQGFAKYTSDIPMIVTGVKVFSDSTQQLNKPWNYVTVNPTAEVTRDGINVAAFAKRSDDRTNFTDFYGCWLLDAAHSLETDLLGGGKGADYILQMNAVSNVRSFTQYL
jgi:hypothetical protein